MYKTKEQLGMSGFFNDLTSFAGQQLAKLGGSSNSSTPSTDSITSGTPVAIDPAGTTPAATAENKPNYLLYGGIAAAGVVGYMIWKKKGKKRGRK